MMVLGGREVAVSPLGGRDHHAAQLAEVVHRALVVGEEEELVLDDRPPRVARTAGTSSPASRSWRWAKEFLAWVDSVFAKAKTLPLTWLVPDFRTTVVTDPPARPNSASKLDVPHVDGVDRLGGGDEDGEEAGLVVVVEAVDLDVVREPRLAVELRLHTVLGVEELGVRRVMVTVPGTVAHIPWKLRPWPRGISWTSRPSIVRPVSARSVWRTGVSWITSTVSVIAPTSRMMSTRIVELTLTSTPSRENFLNPVSSVSTR